MKAIPCTVLYFIQNNVRLYITGQSRRTWDNALIPFYSTDIKKAKPFFAEKDIERFTEKIPQNIRHTYYQEETTIGSSEIKFPAIGDRFKSKVSITDIVLQKLLLAILILIAVPALSQEETTTYDYAYTGVVITQKSAGENSKLSSQPQYEISNICLTYGKGINIKSWLSADAAGSITFNSAMISANAGVYYKNFQLMVNTAVILTPLPHYRIQKNPCLGATGRISIGIFSSQVTYINRSLIAAIGVKVFE
ncbi:MAG TPA: hypothetical protein PL045_07080 [Chitinophagaceae bacterium]|nr:hypothetical protein [Chitinophagaceae bacterium]